MFTKWLSHMRTTLRGIFSSGSPSVQDTVTTLKASDPHNTLNVSADPVVIPYGVLGRILFLIEAPAPDFIPDKYFQHNSIEAFDPDTIDLVPTAYYKRSELKRGFVKI